MAKTIEQRAEEYVYQNFSRIGDDMPMEEGMKTLYTEAVTEQRKIDIERACDIYRKELSEIIGNFNHLGKQLYNINELGELISLEGSVKDFKKAMEEEQ